MSPTDLEDLVGNLSVRQAQASLTTGCQQSENFGLGPWRQRPMLATCPPLWALWACRPSTRTLGAHRKSKATHFAAKVLEPANSTLQDRIIRAHASIWAPLPDTRLALPLSLTLTLTHSQTMAIKLLQKRATHASGEGGSGAWSAGPLSGAAWPYVDVELALKLWNSSGSVETTLRSAAASVAGCWLLLLLAAGCWLLAAAAGCCCR